MLQFQAGASLAAEEYWMEAAQDRKMWKCMELQFVARTARRAAREEEAEQA